MGKNLSLADQIAKLSLEDLRKHYEMILRDSIETEDNIRDLCRPYVEEVEHDGYAVIPVEDVVEQLIKNLKS